MADELAARLARNLKHLRTARGLTQDQIARLAAVPRATWANLESGTANPTLAVLHRVAVALQVSLEEIISAPRATTRFFPRDQVPLQLRSGGARVRKLLPDRVPGLELDRIELPPGARMVGVPHTPGTREYLTCEAGVIVLFVAGERWELAPGDVVVFRGDQRHSYQTPPDARETAVGYSVVMLAPVT